MKQVKAFLYPRRSDGRRSTWEPEHEQETTFGGGKTQERMFTNSYIDSLYKGLSKHYKGASDATHYDYLKREGKQL